MVARIVKVNRLAVVHWFPLELYPPATNLLTYFASQSCWDVMAITCADDRGQPEFQCPGAAIHRWMFPGRSYNRLRRWVAYFGFPVFALLKLIWHRPKVLLYIEPHSAFPAFVYCLLARRCRLFIHYHEYRDPKEYLQAGMRLVRFYNWIEKRLLYRRAEWISHTNDDRRRMFQGDHPDIDAAKLRILPNYPPVNWTNFETLAWQAGATRPLKLVYVGSLSVRDTFIKELVEWVKTDLTQLCELDVYSFNHSPEIKELFTAIECNRIRFHSHGVRYDQLPALLCKFHVGLILYKANTRNYVYNASNKLFEYLAVGLDVWYPKQMLGVKPYARQDKAPRVWELDFADLGSIDPSLLNDRNGIPSEPVRLNCESVLRDLDTSMMQSSHA